MSETTEQSLDMILVHGAFHGGWCWAATARVLTDAGVRVHTPSLTGLGDRRHLFSPSVGLATHVTDIVNLIELEDLEGCVLVGHSYAGNVLTGVADQLRDRVAHYIFVDASVPTPGSTRWGWSFLNPDQWDTRMAQIEREGNGARVAPVPGVVLRGHRSRAGRLRRRPPLPHAPGHLHRADRPGQRRGGRACAAATSLRADPAYGNMADTVARLRHDPDWTFRELAGPHDMMVTHPVELAELLLDLIDSSG